MSQAEGHNLWDAQLLPLVKDNVVVDVDHAPSVLVQQDVVQMTITQAQQVANLSRIHCVSTIFTLRVCLVHAATSISYQHELWSSHDINMRPAMMSVLCLDGQSMLVECGCFDMISRVYAGTLQIQDFQLWQASRDPVTADAHAGGIRVCRTYIPAQLTRGCMTLT